MPSVYYLSRENYFGQTLRKHWLSCNMKWSTRILWILELLLNLVVTTIALPIVLFFYIYRYQVILIAKIIHPQTLQSFPLEQNVHALGSRKEYSSTIITIVIINGILKKEKYLNDLQERILSLKNSKGEKVYEGLKFFVQIFLGYPFWKRDEDFNVEKHVRNYDYTGDLALSSAPTQVELKNIAGILLTHPWVKNQSPWEILLIENFEGLAQTAVLIRCDHVLGDAFSGIEMARKFYQMEFAIPDFKLSMKSILGTGKFIRVLNTFKEFFNRPPSFFQAKLPIGGHNGSGVEIIFGPEMSVDVIKSIKDHYNVSYASVCYSALSGAIARIFTESGRNLSEQVCCRIVLPKPNHPGGLANHSLIVTFQLPLKVTSREKRLNIIHDSLVLKSKSLTPLLVTFGAKIAGVLPSSLLSWMFKMNPEGVQGTMSMVPITTGPLFYDGLEIVDFFPVVYSPEKIGFLVVFAGINNKQRLGISIYTQRFPSNVPVGKISDYFNDEIQALTMSINAEP